MLNVVLADGKRSALFGQGSCYTASDESPAGVAVRALCESYRLARQRRAGAEFRATDDSTKG